MFFLGGVLTSTATVYNIDYSNTTQSGQPLEELVQVGTIKCLLTNNLKKFWGLFDAGQIKTGAYSLLTDRAVTANQVIEIDSVKYRVTATREIKLFKCSHVMGHQSYLELFKH